MVAADARTAVAFMNVDNAGGERSAEIPHTLTAGSSDYQGICVSGVGVTVTDDDGVPGGIALSVDTVGRQTKVGEGAGATTVEVTATVTGGTTYGAAQTVAVSVGAGTATVTDDFAAVAGFGITIPARTASARGMFTLTDDDVEGAAITFTVTRSGATGNAVSVKWRTAADTAGSHPASGADHVAQTTPQILGFAAGTPRGRSRLRRSRTASSRRTRPSRCS